LFGVHEVAVVAERDRARAAVVQQRLRVLPAVAAGRRVARVADRDLAAQAGERPFVEHLRHEPEVAERGEPPAFADGDARRLLPAMLQRIETEVRQPRDVAARRADPEDAAHQSSTNPTQPTTGVGGIGAPPVSLYSDTLPDTTGMPSSFAACVMPSIACASSQPISGFSGFPKFRQSV